MGWKCTQFRDGDFHGPGCNPDRSAGGRADQKAGVIHFARFPIVTRDARRGRGPGARRALRRREHDKVAAAVLGPGRGCMARVNGAVFTVANGIHAAGSDAYSNKV